MHQTLKSVLIHSVVTSTACLTVDYIDLFAFQNTFSPCTTELLVMHV